MAAVSAPQATGSSLTPPTSSHSNWDFAVPANARSSQDYAYSSKEPLPSDNDRDRRHKAPVSNTRARPSRSNSHDQQAHLAPRVAALHPKPSPINGNSPSDSLVDLYANSSKSGSTSLHDGERLSVGGNKIGDKRGSMAMMDEDDPGWIHRDKLARIESRELQAAGIVLPRNRAYSKTGRGNRSRETSASGQGMRGKERRPHAEKGQSCAAEEDQERERGRDEGDGKEAWDLRSQEEIEADSSTYNFDRSGLGKGASKIPLAMTSRLPVPLDYVTRDKPAQRQKSGAWGSDGENASIEYPRPPPRAASVEPEAPQPASAPVLLPPPPKAQRDSGGTPGKRNTQSATHSPTKNGPGNNVRKSNTTKTPPVSNTHGGNGRPKTRSGSQSQSRPVTRGTGELKRPEGDPPWLATMFKPDPRLPPDQQLLPTVAKRLAQENWEKEGKFGNAYDTNFRPLNDEELRRQELPPSPTKSERDKLGIEIPPHSGRGEGGGGEWPLKSPDKEGRPSTGGGYSTMPRISNQPLPKQAPVIEPNPPKVEQMDVESQGKKKGGCGCCVMM